MGDQAGGGPPLPLPPTDSGGEAGPAPNAAPSPAPGPAPGGVDGYVHDLVSADPSAGTASGPRGLRGLLLPGADAYMRDVEARARAGGVQSIAFDRAGVDKAIARVQDIGRQLRDAEMHAEYLTNIVRRGEPVSDHYAGTANEAGRVYVEHLDSFKAELEQ